MITRLLELQRQLMKVLYIEPDGDKPYYKEQLFRDAAVGMAKEALEVHEAAGQSDKPWKSFMEEDVREEMIDVLFYWLEAVAIAGYSDRDIEQAYYEKFQKNLKRIIRSTGPESEQSRMAVEALSSFRYVYSDELDQGHAEADIVVVDE